MKKSISRWWLILFLAVAFLISCKKEYSGESDSSKKTTNTTICDTTISDSARFIDVTIDGVRTLGIADPNQTAPCSWGGWWGGLGQDNSTDTVVYINNFVFEGLTETIGADTNNLSFIFGKNYFSDSGMGNYNYVASFFAPGNYDYVVNTGMDTTYTDGSGLTYTKKILTRGISITWIDSTGTIWRNWLGTADQTGSSFTIIKNLLEGDPLQNIVFGTIVTASFNCNLYDGKGHVKKLTNGRFRLNFWL